MASLLTVALVYVISFISLFFSFFWISMLYFEEPGMHKRPKLKRFPKVSIIVPAYNEEDSIADTLRSLLELDYPRNKLEIIVVANACKDKTAEIVRSFKRVKLIETPLPGKAKAQNLGMKHAKGEIIVIGDADMLVSPDALRKVLPYFEDPLVGEVISAVKVHKPKTLLEKVQRYEYIISSLIRQLMSGIGALFMVPGAFVAFRKSIVEKLGGFDERTLTEDLEMGTRLLRHNYKIISNLDVHIQVRAPRTLAAFHNQRMRWNRGFLEVFAKHRDVVFNPKYGFFGFLFPFFIAVPVLLTATFSIAAATTASFFATYSPIISLTDARLFIENILPNGPLDINVLIAVPAIAILVAGIYMYNKANKHLKEKWTSPSSIFTFIFLYPMWLTFYWLLAFGAHIAKVKREWRGAVRW